MSIAFESPSQRIQNENYFTPLNMPPIVADDGTEQSTTPYFTAPINPVIHQDFLNAIHARQATQPTILNPIERRLSASGLGSLAARRRERHNNNNNNNSNEPIQPQQLVVMGSHQLHELMRAMPQHILILDVRCFVQYSHARLHTAINVSIPNTILKRSTFTIDKVYEAIVLESDRIRLQRWQEMQWIVFYDQSTLEPPNHHAAVYLSAKLLAAGYKNNLAFLRGGYDGFSSTHIDQCETNSMPTRSTNGSTISRHDMSKLSTITTCAGTTTTATITGPGARGSGSSGISRKPNLHLGSIPSMTPSQGPFTAPMPQFENQSFNPFFSNIRQNMEMAHGPIRERFPIRLPPSCRIADSQTGSVVGYVRQPRQISHSRLGGQAYLAPEWLRNTLVEVPGKSSGPSLLGEMYESLERTEQRRLQNIMYFHSKHQTTANDFPLSIVAGIEMGACNRYTNIWPFEYARVKMTGPPPGSTGYINASFIQYCDAATPPTASQVSQVSLDVLRSDAVDYPYRRYISTQGPLPTTFADFWQVMWEQNSRVVVMLTKEEEMNKIKCHRYWPLKPHQSTQYGSITVTLVSEHTRPATLASASDLVDEDDVIIERQLVLSRDKYPPRTVTHLQYMGWIDFGVPDNPVGTLQVVYLADMAQKQYKEQRDNDASMPRLGPMVVHCSAGCGRSGAFCAIDTVIHRLTSEKETASSSDLLYDVIARFREQRLSMVQTLRQFVFCYEAIWWWMLGYGGPPTPSLFSPSSCPPPAASLASPPFVAADTTVMTLHDTVTMDTTT